MKVVFETTVEDRVYRHIHFSEATEATLDNLMFLIEELSNLIEQYNKDDFTRQKLELEFQRDFTLDKTVAVIAYRASKLLK